VVSAVLNGALPVAAAGFPAADQQYLLEARQMQALSLAVHIPLVCFGMAFPAMVLFCEWRYLRTGDLVYRTVARRWSRIMLALFAVGVVTGTILSFELGLLWPEFMASFANVFGLGFALEGFSFFVEAIFIAIYVYGWDRLRPRLHFLSGIPVAIAGVTGSLFVISVNGWMNHPSGFQLEDGRAVDADPWSALFGNSYFWHEFIHMYFAAYIVAGFLVAAAYAWGFLRGRWGRYQRTALTVALSAAAIAAPLQVVIGDWAAREVAAKQPVKLAALEGLGPTTEGAPEHLLGWYNGEEVVYGIEIPRLLSLLAYHDPDATVTGLDSVPADERPPVNVVRFAFQTMVGIGRGRVVQHPDGPDRPVPLPRQQDPQPLGPTQPRLTTGPVESPLRRDPHGGFGERPGETDRGQPRHRAPGRLDRSRPRPAETSAASDARNQAMAVPVRATDPTDGHRSGSGRAVGDARLTDPAGRWRRSRRCCWWCCW
jgi:cytochrome d ubiquinol oxidase subunit I